MTGLWLAIDTATDTASVALGRPPDVERVAFARGARRHAAEILRLVDECLRPFALRPADLDGIVIGDGPGSFTGLRIGWAVAKGLAQEAGLELRAVPSLMAAAQLAGSGLGDAPVAACYDALRGQIYGAVYRFRPARVAALIAPRVTTVAELARLAPENPRVAVGDGAVQYAEQVRAWTGLGPLALAALPPLAQAHLALVERAGAGCIVGDPATAEPVYGRPAEAQVKWEARHGRPLPNPSR